MTTKLKSLYWLCLIPLGWMQAQTFTLSGYLRDTFTGEELLYAGIGVPEAGQGVQSNEYGFYSISLPRGQYRIVFSYVGYSSKTVAIQLDKDLRMDVELSAGAQLKEVEISAKKPNEQISSTQMGVISLDIRDAKTIPVLFGEQDILKTIQLLPGVSPNCEGNSGFFVRGGDTDQNLVLLDEAPVYNASHMLGFFSVFNSDALKDVKLYKGGVPAQYGGRLSSVLDIRMKNGNSKTTTLSGGIGLISSRLTLETPLDRGNGSLLLAGRRTYADLLYKMFAKDGGSTQLYFYDFNAKANYNFGEKDRLYLSGYFGRDKFQLGRIGLDWGNTTGTLRWNHIFNDRLFCNTSFIYSDYDYGFGVDYSGTAIELNSGIFNYHLKQDFHWYKNPNNSLQFGWNAILHQFKPGQFYSDNASADADDQQVDLPRQQALETGIYFDNEQKINQKWSWYYGFRFSSFSNIGPFEVKTYNDYEEITGQTAYSRGSFYHTYFGWEPRTSATYLIDNQRSVKASYHRMYQYLHLLSNSGAGAPTDLWMPSTPLIQPEIGDQWSIGYFQHFGDDDYEFSVETFWKTMRHQVDYEDGADIYLNADLETELVFGKGRAYGAEWYLKKNTGKFTGWVAYTLSKSERQFDAIHQGNWFSARQDRTHNLSVVAAYQFSPQLSLSAGWVYYTGDAVTFPSGKYSIDDAIITLYTQRNGDRMPDYHRLDLGLNWVMQSRKHWVSELNFSIYNAYNRKNAFSIDFRESETNPNQTIAVKTALFGIIPSVTWNFNFK